MTTDEMKLALMWYLRWKLWYPLVVAEGTIHKNYYGLADILALRKTMAIEVEIKKEFCEIKRDLKIKQLKHWFYLREGNSDRITKRVISDRIPNKFYFALPSGFKDAALQKYKDIIPKPYGLIVVEDDDFLPHHCHMAKRAQYLTKHTDHFEKLKERMSWRLTAENIDLRQKLMEKSK